MNKNINLIATTTFGLEAIVKRELDRLGLDIISTQNGRVDFTGDLSALVKSNLWLRSADRVLLKICEFKAFEFEDLFQNVKAFDWGAILPEDANFIITGKSVKSKLSSVPACQSVVEKAIIEKLKTKYKINRFPKTGTMYKIQVSILKDVATVTIDTSGEGLHKRGYREVSVTAPLKETLAAALVDLSFWKPDRILMDPTCGSGTILIEAAMIGRNIAPGLSRKFVSEQWEFIPTEIWKQERKKAYEAIDYDREITMYGTDIDAENINVAKENAFKAGVDDCITFETKSFKEVALDDDYGVIICNPPYGERIGSLVEVENLYRDMGKLMKTNDTWSFYTITSHEEFEKLYGKRANKKRKLYNGKIKIDYYQYFGKRPDKK